WNKRLNTGYGVSLWIAEDKETGAFLGQCGSVPQTVNGNTLMEIGYMFARRHWGNGYAQEAARACLDYGFNERQFGKMTALIDPGNKASIRVAEKIGMHYSQTIRKWNKPIAVSEIKYYN
ncbi:GNAT family N-acetyltransferase, partial [Ligilactobacillus salivarius]